MVTIPVCRVCLNPSMEYIDFETPFELDDTDNEKNQNCDDSQSNPFTYLDCLRMCTRLEIGDYDGINDQSEPQSLCDTCGIELRITYDFLQKAKRAHEIIQEAMQETKVKINEYDWSIEYESAQQDLKKKCKNKKSYINDHHTDLKKVQANTASKNTVDDDNILELIHTQKAEEELELMTVAVSSTSSFDPLSILQEQHQKASELIEVGINVNDDVIKTTPTDPKRRHGSTKKGIKVKSIKTTSIQPSRRGGKREPKETIKKEIFLCHFCPRTYRDANQFRQHTLTHEGKRERNFACEQCGQKFFLRTTLNDHIKTHDTNRLPTFQCDKCDKTFFHKSSLRLHMPYHSDKRIECLICGKRYVRQTELTVHSRTHSGDLPYKCQKCDKAFAKMDRLNRHLRSYHDGYRFKCNVCDREYMHQSSLGDHYKEHTGLPLKCSICDKGFTKMSRIHLHLKVAHKVKSTEEMDEFIVKIETQKQYLRIKGITSIKPILDLR